MQTAEQLRVKEIHTAVDVACENLLMDMPYDEFPVEMLKKLGFTNSINVVDHDDHLKNRDRARYYRSKYPMYKFITEHQLTKIREKYGLVEGDLSQFKGDIPVKNIKDMMNFKIQRGDVRIRKEVASWRNFERMFGIDPSPFIIDDMADVLTNTLTSPIIERRRSFGPPSVFDAFERDASRRDIKREEDYLRRAEAERTSNSRFMSFTEINEEFKRSITITADKELFKDNNPWYDPIVTVMVDGGYLIVTAWGAEASDLDVVNHINN